MLHFKNALPAPFPPKRFEVKATGKGDYIVWDNDLTQTLGLPACWDDAHTVAEDMERRHAARQKQIEAEEAGLYDGMDEFQQPKDRSHLIQSVGQYTYEGNRRG